MSDQSISLSHAIKPGLSYGARLIHALRYSAEIKGASIGSFLLSLFLVDNLNIPHPYIIIGLITALIHLVSIVLKAHITERRSLIEKLYQIGQEAAAEKAKEQEARHAIANRVGDAMLIIGYFTAAHRGDMPEVVDNVLRKLTTDPIYGAVSLHTTSQPEPLLPTQPPKVTV
jgi:hypothetical protein